MSGQPTEALSLGKTALAAHDKALGRDHAWTKDSARVTADALDALGRAEEAKTLRERYGVTPPENPILKAPDLYAVLANLTFVPRWRPSLIASVYADFSTIFRQRPRR